MISRKTVLVLGAGASHEYGLPLGDVLRRSMFTAPSFTRNGEFGHAFAELGTSEGILTRFATTFQASGDKSIDAWLARNPAFVEVGKLCIAFQICSQERPSKLEGGWYEYLWNAMLDGGVNFEEIGDTPLRIITFNYDRSLEAYLGRVIQNAFPVKAKDAQRILDKIKILHVHGDVGKFAIERGEGSADYSEKPNGNKFDLARQRLRIIPEARDGDEAFTYAQAWFRWAENIIFLGFHFDGSNVKRLDLRSIVDERSRTPDVQMLQVFASAMGRTRAEVDAIDEMVCGPSLRMRSCDGDCISTLRNFHVLR